MNSAKIILSVVVLLVVFLLGGGLGVMYQPQRVNVPQQISATSPIVQELSSKLFPSIIAYGKITAISGNSLTLTYSGSSATINVKSGAPVYSFATDKTGKSSQQKVDFSQIKKDDNVNVNSVLLTDGTLQGQSVIILPASINVTNQ